jgi:hypothetical protein
MGAHDKVPYIRVVFIDRKQFASVEPMEEEAKNVREDVFERDVACAIFPFAV